MATRSRHRLRGAPRGPLRAPLGLLLGTGAKVATLRVIAAAGSPITQREVARRAGTQVRSAQIALEDLVTLGIVARTQGGRDHLVAFDRRHHLAAAVEALYAAEADAFRALRERLDALVRAHPARRRAISLAVFGSGARGDDTAGSDLDLFLVAADVASRDALADAVRAARDELHARFGVEPKLLAMTLAEARRGWRMRRPPLPQIVADAIPIAGPPLRDLLDG